MKDYFEKYLSGTGWVINERKWEPDLQGVRETQFTIGNGYLGSRGVLEEKPWGATPGTYIAGLYDRTGAMVTELVNMPNPFDFKIINQGEKLDIVGMDIISHTRKLDMKKGLLLRRTVYKNSRGRCFDYQSLRFFSMNHRHTGVMQVFFTPLDSDTYITVQDNIDITIMNQGVLTEGYKRHFQITNINEEGPIFYVSGRTFESKIGFSYAYSLTATRGKNVTFLKEKTFRMRIKKNETVCFTKICSLYTTMEVKRPIVSARRSVKKNITIGFDQLLKDHIDSWREKWEIANIEIHGDQNVEKAIRFNIYHLIIAGNDKDYNSSIGARTLSGKGYRGHVFWDTEIFILPFFIYNFPKIARNLLLYRFKNLDMARRIADERGYRGVLFPWESADKGIDETPTWHKNLDGSIIKINTMRMEQHISSDIAWGVMHYYSVTKDEEFLVEYGLEILFEVARFWASRVWYNKRIRRYEIKSVIGPDEFHEDVNNNAYTNYMARWSMLTGLKMYNACKNRHKQKLQSLCRKIRLTQEETEDWRKIANKVYIPLSKDKKIIEQFSNYFKRRYVPIKEFDSHGMPVFPKSVSLQEVQDTQLVKQADVVMLLYLMSITFTPEQIRQNYDFYRKRTLHKSSLSPSIHAIVGAKVGRKGEAYKFFLSSLYADLEDIHNNTFEGIHAASCGGVWQTVICAFAGMNISSGTLSFNPRLPSKWKEIKFKLVFRNNILDIGINRKKITIRPLKNNSKHKLKVRVCGFLRDIKPKKLSVFPIKGEGEKGGIE